MTDLIVDFPQRQRDDQRRGRRRSAGVQFAPESEILIYARHPEADPRRMWYTAEEYASFRTAARRDVRNVRGQLLEVQSSSDGGGTTAGGRSDPTDALRILDVSAMIGIENLLSPAIVWKMKAARVQCRRAVLDEQERQDGEGECDPDLLAAAAGRCTEWSKQRARMVGLLQSDVFGDVDERTA